MKTRFPQISQIAQAVEGSDERPGFKGEHGVTRTQISNLDTVCVICEICGPASVQE